jgi:hypothetical protein
VDYHRGLVDLLKELRTARARKDGPAVEAAYARLATHAKSLETLVHFLHDCRARWGANLRTDEIVTGLTSEHRSGVRTLYPAVWDHLSEDPVFAELERWLRQASESAPASRRPDGTPLADGHRYCSVGLTLEQIGVSLGMSNQARSRDVRALLEEMGITFHSVSRKQHLVAVDTIPKTYRKKFAQFLKDHHGVREYLEADERGLALP